ncbi:MAG: zinc ribbon domain-containing protein [Chloroflexota bacterium]
MPVYEYRCPKCGTDFELMRPISRMNHPASCPGCGAKGDRLLSVFASKEGFYVRAPSKPAFRAPAKPAGKPAKPRGAARKSKSR